VVEKKADVFRGYHILAYGNPVEAPQPGFIAYYKICRAEEAGYFEAGSCVIKGCTPQPLPSAEEAVDHAIALARQRVHEYIHYLTLRAYQRTWPLRLEPAPA
jgi:hypothetical protein